MNDRLIWLIIGIIVTIGSLLWLYFGLKDIFNTIKKKDTGWKKLLVLAFDEGIWGIRTFAPFIMIVVGVLIILYGIGVI